MNASISLISRVNETGIRFLCVYRFSYHFNKGRNHYTNLKSLQGLVLIPCSGSGSADGIMIYECKRRGVSLYSKRDGFLASFPNYILNMIFINKINGFIIKSTCR